jgi:hypothetical protein
MSFHLKSDKNVLKKFKSYIPPENIEADIRRICEEELGDDYNAEDFFNLSLKNPLYKFKVLTQCGSFFSHYIPSHSLNEIETVTDLIDFYMEGKVDENPLEILKAKPDLPKNIHIELDYNRFDPTQKNDGFFNGRDAYPERKTIVPSLLYSKKYKTIDKKKLNMFNK